MKILADENIPMVKDVFSHLGDVTTISGRDIKNEILKDVDILLVRSITRVNEELLSGTRVKFVATATIGEDHIDKDYLKKKNIVFSSAPGSNAESVAEYVFTALMVLSKKYNFSLKDKTLGIVGVGNVGSRVKRLADILGVKVLLNDPPKRELTGDNSFIDLDYLLKNSDIVTVHVPLNKTGKYPTYKLINETFLKSMKSGSILINSSRGKVMDENAIISNRERLTGLILDVWADEPYVNETLLKITDIATAHIAGYSYDGKVNGTRMIYEACCRFLEVLPDWKVDISDSSLRIDLAKSDNIVYDAFIQAYPILRDDNELRKILEKPTGEKGKYFDLVRKNYPVRREFENYTVVCKKAQKESNVLKNIGFNLDIV